MKIAFSTGRPAHAVLPVNLLRQRGIDVTIYTSAYRGRFHDLDRGAHLRFAPQPLQALNFITGAQFPESLSHIETAAYDHIVALRMGSYDLFWGWATGALASGRAARRRGARFVLDRACPHVDTQQALVRIECDRLGVAYQPEPAWFRERQLAEYEEADQIVVPSRYTAASFPSGTQEKITIAPLFGRVPSSVARPPRPSRPFTFGTVGGSPVRKGFLYLLQAWEQLRLPNARLLLRTDARPEKFPALRDLLRRLPNVETVGHFPQMQEFYRQCDAFVFPTVDDGFGMALLEAIAHGLPAIATTHCGAAELFQAGEELLLVPPQDAGALAVAMEAIYRSSDLRETLTEQAGKKRAAIEGAGAFALYAQALTAMLDRLHLG